MLHIYKLNYYCSRGRRRRRLIMMEFSMLCTNWIHFNRNSSFAYDDDLCQHACNQNICVK